MHPLIRIIPAPLVRIFARPYVAGDSLEKALDACAQLWIGRRLLATLDLLAEGITTAEQVEQNVQTYLRMVDAVAADPRFADASVRPTLSLKPSSYTTDPMERGGLAAGSREAVYRIAERAKERGVGLTLDMESRHWTEYTLDLLSDLHRDGHSHVGAVIQTRLHRSEQDLARLPAGIRVRLVIGIYKEPAAVALTDKEEMKRRMLHFAGLLLARGHYVEFASHDERYVRRFVEEVAPAAKAGPERFEVQMLYGVPRERFLGELGQRGVRARLYTPFALGWSMAIAYLRRRLDEYPAMIFLVAKNMLFRG
ncbi:MAG: proline dehydrogenase family protein [Planctomycetes bacterium]|nr:proline dehydrogenase family protein [Planctomycetota bacterium]